MPDPITLEAPIVGVTVYSSRARVTRLARTTVSAGSHDVAVAGLPASLLDDSVRVGGRGAARVVGVDVVRRYPAHAPDPRAAAVEERLVALRDRDRGLLDELETEAVRLRFVRRMATVGGAKFAAAMATGDGDTDRVVAYEELLTREDRATRARSLALAHEREALAREIAAAEAELAALTQRRPSEHRDVVISLEADADESVEIELSYLVPDAGWSPVYDARLDDAKVTLTSHGLVHQSTGEDWPVVELALSTARPAAAGKIPELDPWYVGEFAPIVTPRVRAFGDDTARMRAAAPAPMAVEAMVAVHAVAEQGPTAVTWRLPRPVAVPSDGSPHKATITAVELEAVLDYVCVPRIAEEAYLRATVVNTATTTLLPGRVSVFHGADFVGTTVIESIAPGEEIELQLGVDDRVTVERELTKRQTSKNVLGNLRRTSVTYTTTVENHRADPAKVTVEDQFPISTHERVKIDDKVARPEPAERTDLEVLSWELDLAAGETSVLTVSFQIEHPRDLVLSGFTD